MELDGRTLIQQWIRFFVNLLKGTFAITSSGGAFGMVIGLVVFAVALSIAILPLLLLTVLYIGQRAYRALSPRPDGIPH